MTVYWCLQRNSRLSNQTSSSGRRKSISSNKINLKIDPKQSALSQNVSPVITPIQAQRKVGEAAVTPQTKKQSEIQNLIPQVSEDKSNSKNDHPISEERKAEHKVIDAKKDDDAQDIENMLVRKTSVGQTNERVTFG